MVERNGSTIMGHTVQGENKMKSFEEWYEDSGRTISPSVLVQALPFGKDAYTAATEQCRQEIEEISRLSRIVKVYENAIKTAVGFEPFGGLEPRILSGALAKGEETKKANAEK